MSRESLLLKIEQVLDQLVQNALKLNEISSQVISEEQLISLQKQQDKIIIQLLKDNEELEKDNENHLKNKDDPVWHRIQDKLRQFEKLNHSFIEHINSNEGLIQFEEKKANQSKRKSKKNKDN